MTSLANIVPSPQSEWVSFSDGLHRSVTSQGYTRKPVERFLSSSDTSSEGNQNLDGELPSLSHAELGERINKTAVGLDLSSSFSTWVQFEDAPWTNSSPEHPRTASSPKIFCWMCPSLEYSERQPLTSESSWTTTSENSSSPSITPSYTDLQSINTEDLTSGRASAADSTGKRHIYLFYFIFYFILFY
ncbi:stonin-2-like [Crotalus tigris]|uniref:stonin-2-like n=1 Tax=Crotalus tigris TaxID=88082 RepID=UPI00192F3762|nr:stonin-2-like [Crotalus tigris]XP_039190546.1 stonin-2-like [Crotalus tigris]